MAAGTGRTRHTTNRLELVEALLGLALTIVEKVGGKEDTDDEHNAEQSPHDHLEYLPASHFVLPCRTFEIRQKSL